MRWDDEWITSDPDGSLRDLRISFPVSLIARAAA
jgi:hypothetical protein